MIRDLPQYEPDGIIAMMQAFMVDTRPEKIDLGVGVYRDPDGNTPIFRAVKAAEARMLAEQTTKGYLPLSGDPVFNAIARDLVFGADADPSRIATIGTPGGSSAFRQLLALVAKARPNARVWCSDPTWPNHGGIAQATGLTAKPYRYYDTETGEVAWDAMMTDLADIGPDDVVVLHAAAHNPTGADLSDAQWRHVIQHLARTGAMPLVDLAYLGFAEGVEDDTRQLRKFAAQLPTVMVALSGSKSFGLYRDRAAAAFIQTEDAALCDLVQGNLTGLNRLTFGFPPDHGTRVIATILADARMRADWEAELAEMRDRLAGNRRALAAALRDALGDGRFDYLERQRGMFSILGLSDAVVDRLRVRHAVYIVKQGRINIAGLTQANIAPVAAALAAEL